jgi:hypothetical protein
MADHMTADLLDAAKPKEPAAAVKLNTAHARLMLQKRFTAPEWALLEEVAPATGGGTRYADAIAVNLWNSRGHAIHGFEIKVSRSDWLRELKQPEKAEPIYRYCDYWWILAPRGIINPGELPSNWGHYELRDSGIVLGTQGARLNPEPVTREFFASLIRRGHESIAAAAETMCRLKVMEARAEIDGRVKREVEDSCRRHKSLQEQLQQLADETGIDFANRHNLPSARMLKLAQQLEHLATWKGGPLSRLMGLAHELDTAAKTVREAVAGAGLESPEAPEPPHG